MPWPAVEKQVKRWQVEGGSSFKSTTAAARRHIQATGPGLGERMELSYEVTQTGPFVQRTVELFEDRVVSSRRALRFLAFEKTIALSMLDPNSSHCHQRRGVFYFNLLGTLGCWLLAFWTGWSQGEFLSWNVIGYASCGLLFFVLMLATKEEIELILFRNETGTPMLRIEPWLSKIKIDMGGPIPKIETGEAEDSLTGALVDRIHRARARARAVIEEALGLPG